MPWGLGPCRGDWGLPDARNEGPYRGDWISTEETEGLYAGDLRSVQRGLGMQAWWVWENTSISSYFIYNKNNTNHILFIFNS